jgi:hypothetical protein
MRNVVALAALRVAVGQDGEHATRWSMEDVYESHWAEPTFEKTSLAEVDGYLNGATQIAPKPSPIGSARPVLA